MFIDSEKHMHTKWGSEFFFKEEIPESLNRFIHIAIYYSLLKMPAKSKQRRFS